MIKIFNTCEDFSGGVHDSWQGNDRGIICIDDKIYANAFMDYFYDWWQGKYWIWYDSGINNFDGWETLKATGVQNNGTASVLVSGTNCLGRNSYASDKYTGPGETNTLNQVQDISEVVNRLLMLDITVRSDYDNLNQFDSWLDSIEIVHRDVPLIPRAGSPKLWINKFWMPARESSSSLIMEDTLFIQNTGGGTLNYTISSSLPANAIDYKIWGGGRTEGVASDSNSGSNVGVHADMVEITITYANIPANPPNSIQWHTITVSSNGSDSPQVVKVLILK